MRLVVNARFLTQQITGVQQYALRLAKFLKSKNIADIVFVSPKGIIHHDLARSLDAQIIGYTEGFVWEQIELPIWLKRNGNPLLLNLGNVAPQNYSNQVVTIHDLSTIDHPEWYSKKFAAAYKVILPKIIRNSKLVIAVSETTKARILELYDIPSENILVVYNTIDLPDSMYEPFSQHPYFLAVGSFNGRKNLLNLVHAFNNANIQGYKLKIRTNKEDIYNADAETFNYITHCPNVIIVDTLNYQAYMELIRNARLMINLAVYEGFGMPNLEALSLGVPLICSDIPVFREVCKDEANYVDPSNISEVEQMLKWVSGRATDDYEVLQRRKRASKFTMETEGNKLIETLKSLAV